MSEAENSGRVRVRAKLFGHWHFTWTDPENARQIRAQSQAWSKRKRLASEKALRALRVPLDSPEAIEHAVAAIRARQLMENSDTRLNVILKLTAGAPPSIFWPTFFSAWTHCDDTWEWREYLLNELQRHHATEPGRQFLAAPDRALFDALPETVTIYRGCSRARILGLSWTLSREIAEGFAIGYRRIPVLDPVFATAIIPRSAIFAVFTERKESEILIDPDAASIEVSSVANAEALA